MPWPWSPRSFRDQHQGCARAPVASVIDPADAGHQRVLGVLDLPLACLTAQLPYRFKQVFRRAGCLAGGDLPAAGVERQVAVVGEVRLADVRDALAGLAEAKRLH